MLSMRIKTRTHFALFIALLFIPYLLQAKDSKPSGNLKTEIKEYIFHHLEDAYDFSLFSYTKDNGDHKYIGMPLPVILWDNGLQIFSSSKLNHGKSVAQVGPNFYKLDHGKIFKTNALGVINLDADKHITNEAPLDFSITKGVFSMFLIAFFMFFLFNRLAKSYLKNDGVPSGVGRFFEPIIIYLRDEIAKPNIGERKYRSYMSFLLTVFFFIWFLNMLGLTPLGVNVTGNIAVTFSLALLTFLITNLTANKNYWGHIFWMPGVPVLIKVVLAPIELLGVFIKPFSLLIRLYANIQAGHIVLYSLIGLMFIFNNLVGSSLSFVLAFFISIIEILVALLQAYIFTMLSALYFGFAVAEHEGNH